MFEKDPASPAVADTSPSETPSTRNVDTSDTDIEKQCRELPSHWRKADKVLCWTTVGQTNLEKFWVHVSEEGWEKGSKRLRDAVTQITTAVCILLPSLSCKLTHLFS